MDPTFLWKIMKDKITAELITEFNSRIAEATSLLRKFRFSSLDLCNRLCKLTTTNQSPIIIQSQEPITSSSTWADEPREANAVQVEIFPPAQTTWCEICSYWERSSSNARQPTTGTY